MAIDLFSGPRKFFKSVFEVNPKQFNDLANSQKPHTLFIGCADSRVVPSLISQTGPGEIFVVRNIANVVPKYDEKAAPCAVSSALEYAVQVLEVQNIIVCGHSNCGGCAATAAKDEDLEHLPITAKWITHLAGVQERAREESARQHSDLEMATLVERENIKLQLENLMTYPEVEKRVAANTLKTYGWHYDIGHGKVYNFNSAKNSFDCIN